MLFIAIYASNAVTAASLELTRMLIAMVFMAVCVVGVFTFMENPEAITASYHEVLNTKMATMFFQMWKSDWCKALMCIPGAFMLFYFLVNKLKTKFLKAFCAGRYNINPADRYHG